MGADLSGDGGARVYRMRVGAHLDRMTDDSRLPGVLEVDEAHEQAYDHRQ